ncbi:MAG: hypothetical protein AB4372_27125 [Xenococcus sp. (in: cyanobacteria)]
MGKRDKEILSDIWKNLHNIYDELYFTDTRVINFSDKLNNFIEQLSNRENSDAKAEIEEFKELIKKEIMADIKQKIGQAFNKNNLIVDANFSATQELEKSISETKEFMKGTLNLQLQEVNQQFRELMEYRNEVKELQEKIKSWQDTAVEFFQYIERTLEILRESDEKNTQTTQESISSRKALCEKVLKDFERSVNPLGLQRICPKSSEDVNKHLHKVVSEKESKGVKKESKGVKAEQIIECKKWGYAINGRLYGDMRAEVIVAKSSEPNKNANQGSESELENSEPPKDDAQDLAPNSETPDDNKAAALDSVDEENGQPETPLNQPEIPQTPDSNLSSNSDLDKSGEDGKNNLQGSQVENTSTSE